jgi:signal transduction histidine kinase
VTDAPERSRHLEARLMRVAREKASLELVTIMMASLDSAAGVPATAAGVLRCVLEHVGGTDAVAWVAVGARFLRVDATGAATEVGAIDCPHARAAFASGEPRELESDAIDAALLEPPARSATTCAFPLRAGSTTVGVARFEALPLSAFEVAPQIGLFFRMAALLLHAEVASESAVRRAYGELAESAAELARAKNDLEGRVAERTAELVRANARLARELAERTRAEAEARRNAAELRSSREQLRQAQKMEALGLLAGGVAHDFNNLLQAILGFGSLLRGAVDHPDDVESVEEILSAATRASELTRALLAFSRKQPFSPAPLDLNDVLRDQRKLLARIIGEDIALETRLADEPLVVNGDRAQLEQVLLNLATNARDAMPRGGRLTLAATLVDVAGVPTARVSVEDSGVGIRAPDLARIFEPFFTTKAPGHGTGLGLAIAYGVVAQHGGRIAARSEPGTGTTFEIDLPLHGRPASERPSIGAAPARGGGESVLVVEDEPAVRGVLYAVLSRAGYDVTTAADGREAVELVSAGLRFDLVILDMLMPRMNGGQALVELRRRVPGQRALLVSGYTADVLDGRGAAALGAPLLQKPVASATLLAAVRGALDGAGE